MTETAYTKFSNTLYLTLPSPSHSINTILSCELTTTLPETDERSKPIIAVVFYSTYGHIEQLAEGVIKGVEATGAEVSPYVLYVPLAPCAPLSIPLYQYDR